jgi:hypothetical protein
MDPGDREHRTGTIGEPAMPGEGVLFDPDQRQIAGKGVAFSWLLIS